MRINRPGVYQASGPGFDHIGEGAQIMETGAKLGLIIGAIKGVRSINKGTRRILRDIMVKKAAEEQSIRPPVYSSLMDPNTKLALNVIAGKGPGRIIVSYIKGGLRNTISKNSLEKQALERPIDAATGFIADMVSLKALVPGMKLMARTGVTNPYAIGLSALASTALARYAAKKALDTTVNVADKYGVVPEVLTKVDPNSGNQILAGNGLSLVGGLIGVGTTLANPAVMAMPFAIRTGIGAARANAGMRIGEAAGTMVGYALDRFKERPINQVNEEPVV